MSTSMKHWPSLMTFGLGAWLAVSPLVLDYEARPKATWDAVALGAAIAVLALISLVRAMAWTEWTNSVLGAWLVISPWVLRFNAMHPAAWNAIAVGAATVVLALWTLETDRDIGGRWKPAT